MLALSSSKRVPALAVLACSCIAAFSTACSRTGLRTLPIPRAIAPLSTTMVTSRRPTLRWTLDGGDGSDAPARVEVCGDRGCAHVLATIPASGTQAVPAEDLPAGMVYWRVLVSFGDDLGTAASPIWEMSIPARSAPVDTAWGTVLDLDGDGLADVAVGAPSAEGSAGRVYVYRSGLAGLSRLPLVLSGPDGALGQFGVAVASAGDVDGDGYGDLLVGAWCAPATSPAAPTNCGPGRAYLYRGGPAGPETTPTTILDGPDVPGGLFAAGVAGAGDVNGDGYADVFVTESQCFLEVDGCVLGRGYVYLGGPGGLSTAPAATLAGASDNPPGGGTYGGSFATGADIDGDGYSDVLLAGWGPPVGGSPDPFSQVYTFRGGPSGVSATPAATLTGGAEVLGVWMATLGDVNGDGYADFAISRGGTCDLISISCPQRVAVHLGGPAGLSPEPSVILDSPAGADFNTIPTGPGDVDGDGYADLVLYDNKLADNQALGQAHLYRGGPSGIVSAAVDVPGPGGSATFEGGALGVQAGVAGDFDGDGFADVLIASLFAGKVSLYRGSAAGLMATTAVLAAPDPEEQYGTALASHVPASRSSWRRKLGTHRQKGSARATENAGARRCSSRCAR
jgi:hypothetical protein